MRRCACLLATPWLMLLACGHAGTKAAPAARDRDELSALWSYYRYTHIEDGRVVARDEGGITTSEGQGYALLRAAWSGDRATFDLVWRWTREHLQVRDDHLLSWKWKGRVLDRNAATDADQDVALALILASRRFGEPALLAPARSLLADIWAREVVRAGPRRIPTGGNWAPEERYPTIHVAYLAPYAYEVFADVDPGRPWRELVRSSYDILHFLFVERGLALPPERIWVDPRTGAFLLAPPGGVPASFGYDSIPIYWRVALDARWFGRGAEADLRRRMLRFPAQQFREEGRLRDQATPSGKPLSSLDGYPHLASVQALAQVEDPALARAMRASGLDALYERALSGEPTPYYLHNWLWFGRALEAGALRRYDEPLAFLLGLDWGAFRDAFPGWILGAALLLSPFSRRWLAARAAVLALALGLSFRYLAWRAAGTLNFLEPLGPLTSIALLAAEGYAFSSVLFLLVQVGLRRDRRPPPSAAGAPLPSVDVLVPIYTEPLEILDRTLTACAALRHPRVTVVVCDDSHRSEVAALAAAHGARYLAGPRRHAKAGNLNAALTRTEGELVVVFDTDHVPCAAFLERTVPHFADPRVGMVQTPHHFYNPDVFQRAFRTGPAVPNEQDLFNHAIQGGRDRWGGAFFVGSGAVFRRAAIDSVGGFNLLSITEDIHTSQKLHAAGWQSRFVEEDLAVGLAAEDNASYLVQRRRWMLGCLQILLRDNPLLQRGLPLRHRLGYLASLWFFLFPLARVVFFATPLLFLLFHLHPLFADLPILLAYLVPHLVAAPLAAGVLLPGWPRMLWSTVYESAVSFPLARATFDLFLPRRLGFKVTPKGLVTDRRRFDLASSRLTLVAAAIAAVALVKGALELWLFGIEVEAYAFNLAWAASNLGALLVALLVAWERPQRRGDERIRRRIPALLWGDGPAIAGATVDLSRTGAAVELPVRPDRDSPAARAKPEEGALPQRVELELRGAEQVRLEARVVYRERVGGVVRAGLAFESPTPEAVRALTRLAFSHVDPAEDLHAARARSQPAMAWALLAGLVRAFAPLRPRRRGADRRRVLVPLSWVGGWGRTAAVVLDRSPGGMGLLAIGRRPEAGSTFPLVEARGVTWARVVHLRRVFPGIHRLGLAFLPDPLEPALPSAFLAA